MILLVITLDLTTINRWGSFIDNNDVLELALILAFQSPDYATIHWPCDQLNGSLGPWMTRIQLDLPHFTVNPYGVPAVTIPTVIIVIVIIVVGNFVHLDRPPWTVLATLNGFRRPRNKSL